MKDIILLFEKMQEQINISYVSVVVFTAIDPDSLCCLKILSVLPSLGRSSSRARTCSTRCTR